MISLYSELIHRRYGLDDDADQFISFVVNGARRMEMLLKDLLTYSQAGSMEGPPAVVDCEMVMDRVRPNLQVAIVQNQAKVTWDSLPMVEAHDIRVMQLFQNLVERDQVPKVRQRRRSTFPPSAAERNGSSA